MKTYQQLKESHQQEFNDFEGIFFAFNDEQFVDGMKKLGLSPVHDTDKIVRFAMGGFILKDRGDALKEMINRHSEEDSEALKDEEFLLDALTYELGNHEFSYTHNDSDAIEAIGLKREEIPAHILDKAKRRAA